MIQKNNFVISEPMSFLKESETPLMIGFLAAQGSGQDGCLSRAACRAPNTAAEYTRAARALLKGAEMFDTYASLL